MKRLAIALLCGAMLLIGSVQSATAEPPFPASLPLPAGFYPEGIAIGAGTDFYVGSLFGGAVYKGDLRTGEGAVFALSSDGRVIAGLSFDARSGLLWGVGSEDGAGRVFVFDGATGALIEALDVPGSFLNDLAVTSEAVYVTDSLAPVMWRIPTDHQGRPAAPVEAVPLTGDFEFVTTGNPPINLNGIAATPNGQTLLAVHTTLGVLYSIDPTTGVATKIDLGGGAVPSGDGIVLHGRTLYVVQNFLNQVAVVTLNSDLTTGRVTDVITSDLFRVPTTAARFGHDLYLVNARFDVALPPLFGVPPVVIDYDVVRVAG